VAVLVLASGATAGAAVPSHKLPVGHHVPKGDFLAVYGYGAGDVTGGHQFVLDAFSPKTGQPDRTILRLPNGADFPTFARSKDGAIWYAISHGPESSEPGGLNNPPLKPHSCGATVYRMDAKTASVKAVFSVDRDSTIDDVVPSRDGTKVVYTATDCSVKTADPAQELVVRNLAAGTSTVTTMAQGAVSAPLAWTTSGARVVASAYSGVPTDNRVGYVEVASGHAGTLTASDIRGAPDAHCSIEDVAPDRRGLLAAEDCPRQHTTIVAQIGKRHSVAWRHREGRCVDATVRPTRNYRGAIVDIDQACGGAGHTHTRIQHVTESGSVAALGHYVTPRQWVWYASW
jgi:hypothetical protein